MTYHILEVSEHRGVRLTRAVTPLTEKECEELHRVLTTWKKKKLLTRYVDEYIRDIILEGKQTPSMIVYDTKEKGKMRKLDDRFREIDNDPKLIKKSNEYVRKISRIDYDVVFR